MSITGQTCPVSSPWLQFAHTAESHRTQHRRTPFAHPPLGSYQWTHVWTLLCVRARTSSRGQRHHVQHPHGTGHSTCARQTERKTTCLKSLWSLPQWGKNRRGCALFLSKLCQELLACQNKPQGQLPEHSQTLQGKIHCTRYPITTTC